MLVHNYKTITGQKFVLVMTNNHLTDNTKCIYLYISLYFGHKFIDV